MGRNFRDEIRGKGLERNEMGVWMSLRVINGSSLVFNGLKWALFIVVVKN